jgi:hypothetical protein
VVRAVRKHQRVPHLLGLDEVACLVEELLNNRGDVWLLAIKTEDLRRNRPGSVSSSDEDFVCVLSAQTFSEHLPDEFALAAEGHHCHAQSRELMSEREKRSEDGPGMPREGCSRTSPATVCVHLSEVSHRLGGG